MDTVQSISASIKRKAHELGFDLCGIARSRSLDEYGPYFRNWLSLGMNDKMDYLAREVEKRLDPGILFPGARSLVVTGLSYFAENMQKDPEAPVLSRYAYGKNYHDTISERLVKLLAWIREFRADSEGKIVVDSAPILEKAWAKEAGLAWQGKHSVMINREIGSFFFIGTLILNIDLEPDLPVTEEHCGKCSICIESCPTGAINENRTIDARKCIANLTIENRGPIPEDLIPLLGRRIYGCDRCQEVCPWNKNARPNRTPEFKPDREVAGMTLEDWKDLSAENFSRLFRDTSAGRVKYAQFKRNIEAITRQSK